MKPCLVSPVNCTVTQYLIKVEKLEAVDEIESDADEVHDGSPEVGHEEDELDNDTLIQIACASDGDEQTPVDVPPPPDVGDEEMRKPKCLRRPGQPSKAEKLEHETPHINYRSWCRYCVRGRG